MYRAPNFARLSKTNGHPTFPDIFRVAFSDAPIHLFSFIYQHNSKLKRLKITIRIQARNLLNFVLPNPNAFKYADVVTIATNYLSVATEMD
jgi:hypothetical protein